MLFTTMESNNDPEPISSTTEDKIQEQEEDQPAIMSSDDNFLPTSPLVEEKERKKENEREEGESEPNRKKIRHIVLSGGGGIGHAFYGALRDSNQDGFWHIDDIKSMHGTSVGAILLIGIALANHIGWDAYDDFFIKRPWESVLDFTAERILNSYSNAGIFDHRHIENIVSPVLKAVDLSLNITLQEIYEFTGIDMHFYTTDLKVFDLVEISHKTHPGWKLLDAIYCSCALPILFKPCKIDGRYYADGACFCNYPITQCVEIADDPDEILGFKKADPESANNIETYNILSEYLSDLLEKIRLKLSKNEAEIKHCIIFEDEPTTATQVYNDLKTRDSRAAKVQFGADLWKAYKTKIGFVPTTQTTIQSNHPLAPTPI